MATGIDIASALRSAARSLEQAGIDDARREAATLLSFILDRHSAFIIAHPEYILTNEEAQTFSNALKRRAAREPYHLIAGKREFYGLEFLVEKAVLIPRPETELLVERAIEIISPISEPRVLDLGLGTGCIAISILYNVPAATAVGADVSDQALQLAKKNALRAGVDGRLNIIRSDLFSQVDGTFDIIVTNPPYIPDGDRDRLQPEVANFDPPSALFSGEDGLDLVRRIVAESPQYLSAGGNLLIEIGQGQAESVKTIFDPATWQGVSVHKDLQGIDRMVEARLLSPVRPKS